MDYIFGFEVEVEVHEIGELPVDQRRSNDEDEGEDELK